MFPQSGIQNRVSRTGTCRRRVRYFGYGDLGFRISSLCCDQLRGWQWQFRVSSFLASLRSIPGLAMAKERVGKESGDATSGMRPQLLGKVRRQAAKVVGTLLKGDADRRASASIKSLIYAPSVVAKKATLALTCQTLKCESSLDLI